MNWPPAGGGYRAWRDLDSRWDEYRNWRSDIIWLSVIGLACTLAAWRWRSALGSGLGIAAYVTCTAAVILGGGLAAGEGNGPWRWAFTLVAGLTVVVCGWVTLRPDIGLRRSPPRVPLLAVVLGAVLEA